MIKLNCDICGKEVQNYDELIKILAIYRVKNLEDMCRSCEKKLNKQLDEIKKRQHNELIKEMKTKIIEFSNKEKAFRNALEL